MRRLALVVALMAAVPAPGRAMPPPAVASATRNAAVFDRVCALVDKHYWDDARLGDQWARARERFRPAALAAASPRMLYQVLNRLLDTVGDSHLFAIDPAQRAFQATRRDGSTVQPGAFGFSSWQRDGAWRVFAVEPGGPAARAGVMIGWRLAAVNGREIDEDWHPPVGAQATLDFIDDGGATRRLRLTAGAMADDAPWRATRLADGTLVARLDEFAEGADGWLRGALAAGPRPPALVLDLRENGGGEAMAVARIAGLFFTDKRTLIEQVGRGRPLAVPVLGAGRRGGWDGPLALLVGPRSASGAEALAALIDESGRGETVGERTAGALTGAALFDLPGGGQLSVAEFDIRTSGGRRLEGVGFTPRHVVQPSDAALRRGEDPVLAAALRLLATDGAAGGIATGPERASVRFMPATQHEESRHGGSDPG